MAKDPAAKAVRNRTTPQCGSMWSHDILAKHHVSAWIACSGVKSREIPTEWVLGRLKQQRESMAPIRDGHKDPHAGVDRTSNLFQVAAHRVRVPELEHQRPPFTGNVLWSQVVIAMRSSMSVECLARCAALAVATVGVGCPS